MSKGPISPVVWPISLKYWKVGFSGQRKRGTAQVTIGRKVAPYLKSSVEGTVSRIAATVAASFRRSKRSPIAYPR
ncbi:MAG: hypothetical protein E6I76_03710 [Chloroflexi bacterium]|nr:MAG: hypothetical protein E6I76_03710 [Chloroflexota bacterium]